MHCPECNFGMLERAGHTDIPLKSGKMSKCPLHHMKCLRCSHISKWRRTHITRYRMEFRLQWLTEIEDLV